MKSDVSKLLSIDSIDNFDELVSILSTTNFKNILSDFVEYRSSSESNFKFVWQYMGMVSTLLNFIRAEREGNWQLHVATFREMLPYFFRYDHKLRQMGV